MELAAEIIGGKTVNRGQDGWETIMIVCPTAKYRKTDLAE